MCEISTLCATFQNYFWKPTVYISVCVFSQSLTLFDPMDCSLPGSSVHGISQARILEWVVISSSRALNPHLLYLLHCSGIPYCWTIRERVYISWVLKNKLCIYHWIYAVSFLLLPTAISEYSYVFWTMEGLFSFFPTGLSFLGTKCTGCILLSHSIMSDSLWPQGL